MVDWDGLENRCASDGTVGSNPTLSSKMLLRITEMGLTRPKNPQLSRGFAVSDRTSETAVESRIGL